MPVTKGCLGKKVFVEGKGAGTLSYYGPVTFQTGDWCGVALDNPVVLDDVTLSGHL